ncbi:hypothetical protein [Neorhodopirellula pilleata]|uniref:Uncharacterized protein n=1 Tax=Neorhodopirellula pilleata TaxID=2714738 RepID=A0A5C5ZW69_9BACT|nr:hypothetical protein [Neorhodopirellula pilleata]TWT91355.1 hypothetical protein Pla100_52030 [Neorhodopirellula pilleata]
MNRRPDWGYRAFLIGSIASAVWMLLTPVVPFVSDCLMRRFHLRTASYSAWALQQAIPPMYSFRNTVEVRNVPLDVMDSGWLDPFLLDPLADPISPLGVTGSNTTTSNRFGVIASRTINHFPAREITFANTRYRYFSEPENRSQADRWFVLESTYGSRSLRSTYELHLHNGRSWRMKLIDE